MKAKVLIPIQRLEGVQIFIPSFWASKPNSFFFEVRSHWEGNSHRSAKECIRDLIWWRRLKKRSRKTELLISFLLHIHRKRRIKPIISDYFIRRDSWLNYDWTIWRRGRVRSYISRERGVQVQTESLSSCKRVLSKGAKAQRVGVGLLSSHYLIFMGRYFLHRRKEEERNFPQRALCSWVGVRKVTERSENSLQVYSLRPR